MYCYTIDRLIGAANMFDLLPKTAVGTIPANPNELNNVCDKFRTELKTLPESHDRDGLLSAIGRIGKHNLKAKIKNRAKRLTDVVGDEFPEMGLVIDEAVNCRNYYVHSTKPRKTNYRYEDFISFFTDTLEFIFSVSDLMEAEWDIKEWISQGSTLSHPFGSYVHSYKAAYRELKTSISKNS